MTCNLSGCECDDHGQWTPEVREATFRAGAAVAFGLMGMAEAIRTRPRYTWKLIVPFGKGGNHSVSWYGSEADATEAGERMLGKGIGSLDDPYRIRKEEIERCDCGQ